MEDTRLNFYYNIQINICAEENWVVDFLVINDYCMNEEEALESLHNYTEFYGWIDCGVSNTIYEEVSRHYGVI